MVFYDDLVKKVNEGEIGELKDLYIFRLGLMKTLYIIGVSIPPLFLGLFEIMVIKEYGFRFMSIVSFFLGFLGIYFLSSLFKYKVIVKNDSLFLNKQEIKFDEMVSCKLENKLLPKGKKIEPALTIITEDNKEYTFYLHMAHKLRYLLIMKKLLGEKFSIVEEK